MEEITNLFVLIILQAILGFDNLLYISIASKDAPVGREKYVRKVGILIAVALRIVLLYLITQLMALFNEPIYHFHIPGKFNFDLNVKGLLVMAGGIFLFYTAIKEIWHMISIDDLDHSEEKPRKERKSEITVITTIVIMNLVFSFDSIFTAIAITNVFWVMAAAIVISGILMLWLADSVSAFIEKNRMYEVMGMFILLIVGIVLLTEGAHDSHLSFFGVHIEAMNKTTFYFVVFTLIIVDIVQSRYQKKLLKQAEQKKRITKEKE